MSRSQRNEARILRIFQEQKQIHLACLRQPEMVIEVHFPTVLHLNPQQMSLSSVICRQLKARKAFDAFAPLALFVILVQSNRARYLGLSFGLFDLRYIWLGLFETFRYYDNIHDSQLHNCVSSPAGSFYFWTYWFCSLAKAVRGFSTPDIDPRCQEQQGSRLKCK